MSALDEKTTYALLAGEAADAVANPPRLRTQVRVRLVGVGTPPIPNDGLWCRSWSRDGFVIAADAGAIPLDHTESSSPSPKHLAGAFDLHFVLSADGYADLPVTIACNHDAIPIRPAAYALSPKPIAVRGRVVVSGVSPTPLVGATVSVTASVPPIAAPAPVLTDGDGTYVFPIVPAANSLTLAVSGGGHSGSQTIHPTYPDPLLTVNFALA